MQSQLCLVLYLTLSMCISILHITGAVKKPWLYAYKHTAFNWGAFKEHTSLEPVQRDIAAAAAADSQQGVHQNWGEGNKNPTSKPTESKAQSLQRGAGDGTPQHSALRGSQRAMSQSLIKNQGDGYFTVQLLQAQLHSLI